MTEAEKLLIEANFLYCDYRNKFCGAPAQSSKCECDLCLRAKELNAKISKLFYPKSK